MVSFIVVLCIVHLFECVLLVCCVLLLYCHGQKPNFSYILNMPLHLQDCITSVVSNALSMEDLISDNFHEFSK
jgi:hypothetical protein